jgi:hypothetical protein
MSYLNPKEAAKVLLTKLNDEFSADGLFDYEKASKAIYGNTTRNNVNDINFALAYPEYSFHHHLIWGYVGLKVVRVFESNGRLDNRSRSEPDRDGTEDCGKEVPGTNSICPPPQPHVI